MYTRDLLEEITGKDKEGRSSRDQAETSDLTLRKKRVEKRIKAKECQQ